MQPSVLDLLIRQIRRWIVQNMFARARKSLKYLQYRYNLETHLYMCEPWERRLVSKCKVISRVLCWLNKLSVPDTVLLLLLSVVLLVSYLYVPPLLGRLRNVVTMSNWVEISSSSLKLQMLSTDELWFISFIVIGISFRCKQLYLSLPNRNQY